MGTINAQIQKLDRLTTIIILITAVMLTISYFLPFEDWSWSYYKMAHGYNIAGGYMGGPVVALTSTFPFFLGVVLILAISLQRWKHLATLTLICYGFLWLASILAYIVPFFQLPGLSFRPVWAASSILLPVFTIALLFTWKHLSPDTTFPVIALILSCGSLISFSLDIMYAVLEDKMLINYGAVVSSVCASVLIVVFFIKLEIQLIFEKVSLESSETIEVDNSSESIKSE